MSASKVYFTNLRVKMGDTLQTKLERLLKTLSDAAQKFFDYITSGEANDIIISAGVVPAN